MHRRLILLLVCAVALVVLRVRQAPTGPATHTTTRTRSVSTPTARRVFGRRGRRGCEPVPLRAHGRRRTSRPPRAWPTAGRSHPVRAPDVGTSASVTSERPDAPEARSSGSQIQQSTPRYSPAGERPRADPGARDPTEPTRRRGTGRQRPDVDVARPVRLAARQRHSLGGRGDRHGHRVADERAMGHGQRRRRRLRRSGHPLRRGTTGREQESDCTYTYRRSSAGQPGGAYRLTVTTTWAVTWTVSGAPVEEASAPHPARPRARCASPRSRPSTSSRTETPWPRPPHDPNRRPTAPDSGASPAREPRHRGRGHRENRTRMLVGALLALGSALAAARALRRRRGTTTGVGARRTRRRWPDDRGR